MAAPEEEDFVYHAHRPEPPMDQAVRRIVLGAGGLSVLVILVALLWSGVRGTGFGPPPVIEAPPGPLRVLPVSPGGLTVPEADETIMSGNNEAATVHLAPPAPGAEIAQLDQSAGVTPQAAVAPAAAAVAPVAGQKGGAMDVQLAATGDEPGAEAEWGALQRKMPRLFAGRTPEILPAVVNGQSVWRLRLGGFADAAAAQAFCASVTAKGGACRVVAP
ncbi:MAG TPA: SPOR domain-containing protein [Acidocella sp.]|nr:MAG: hypothetical protein B7Z81_07385 [Acidocella sp. 20-61-6]HQT47656.1 SPOR domain-containing protein [Acidocella sp.]